MIKTEKEITYPQIVITGYHGCGKSYAASLIRDQLDVVVNLNKYDFITRILMYVLDIQPIFTKYNQINDDWIDYIVIQSSGIREIYDYAKDSVRLYNGMNRDIIEYILINIIKINPKKIPTMDQKLMDDMIQKMTLLYKKRNSPDLSLIFDVTKLFYINILNKIYDFNNKYDFFEYLNSVIYPYLSVKSYNKRIVYYAYSLNEVLFFKEKLKTPVVQIDMEHAIRSNLLAAENKLEKLSLLESEEYKNEMALIKKESTAIIKNDYDFSNTIANKLKSVIPF